MGRTKGPDCMRLRYIAIYLKPSYVVCVTGQFVRWASMPRTDPPCPASRPRLGVDGSHLRTGIDRGSLSEPDWIADLYVPFRQNLGTKSSAMNERREDSRLREFLEMRARLAQPNPAKSHPSDEEVATDKMVERHAVGDHIPPRVAGSDSEVVVTGQGSNRFLFDEGDFSRGPWAVRVSPLGEEVAISIESPSRDGMDLPDRMCRHLLFLCYVEGDYLAGPRRGHKLTVCEGSM